MTSSFTRRSRALAALGIETWHRRGARSSTLQAEASIHPSAAVRLHRVVSADAMPERITTPPAQAALIPTARDVPQDWEGLAAAVARCTSCKLCKTRTHTVFGVGARDAPLMVIGEGPGADEDAKGEPFVGRAGKLLDEMLRAIGRSRAAATPDKAVYIANVVKCRPPGNREPQPDEVEACRPYLDQQIRLLKPQLILALGRVAAQRLLSTDAPLSKLRGPLYEYGEAHTPVLVSYHPAYLLRSPQEKAKSWQDLKRVHRLLATPTP